MKKIEEMEKEEHIECAARKNYYSHEAGALTHTEKKMDIWDIEKGKGEIKTWSDLLKRKIKKKKKLVGELGNEEYHYSMGHYFDV